MIVVARSIVVLVSVMRRVLVYKGEFGWVSQMGGSTSPAGTPARDEEQIGLLSEEGLSRGGQTAAATKLGLVHLLFSLRILEIAL